MRDITQDGTVYRYSGQIKGRAVYQGGPCEFRPDGSMAPTRLYVLRNGRIDYSRHATEVSAKGWSMAEW